MTKKKKLLAPEEMPEFNEAIDAMAEDEKIFVDKAMEIAHHIFEMMDQMGLKQKDLAERMGKTEAEVSKWLGGMHNFTLRSLSKLEAALGVAVVTTTGDHHFHVPITAVNRTVVVDPENEMEVYDRRHSDLQQAKVVQMPGRKNCENVQVAYS